MRDGARQSPYRPGSAIRLERTGDPRPVRLLDDVDPAKLAA